MQFLAIAESKGADAMVSTKWVVGSVALVAAGLPLTDAFSVIIFCEQEKWRLAWIYACDVRS